jgi:hypothetical protein
MERVATGRMDWERNGNGMETFFYQGQTAFSDGVFFFFFRLFVLKGFIFVSVRAREPFFLLLLSCRDIKVDIPFVFLFFFLLKHTSSSIATNTR